MGLTKIASDFGSNGAGICVLVKTIEWPFTRQAFALTLTYSNHGARYPTSSNLLHECSDEIQRSMLSKLISPWTKWLPFRK